MGEDEEKQISAETCTDHVETSTPGGSESGPTKPHRPLLTIARAIEFAAARGYSKCIELLISPVGTKGLTSLRLQDEMKLSSALSAAAANGQLETVKVLLDNGVPLNSPVPDGHETLQPPAYSAAKHGHYKLLSLLIDRGVDLNFITAVEGKTALHAAAENVSTLQAPGLGVIMSP